jgi:hypothetical protein
VVDLVYRAERDAGDLLIVDATDFSDPPVAAVHLPFRVPFGFHGVWIAGASLDSAGIGVVGIDGRRLMAGPNGWDA